MRSHVRNLSAQIFKQAESMCLTPNWCPLWNTHEAFQIETVNIDVNFQFFFFTLCGGKNETCQKWRECYFSKVEVIMKLLP